jgi:hypothetical protein
MVNNREDMNETLEVTQARLDERAKVEEEIESKAYNEAGDDVQFEVESTLDYLTQFSAFKGKLENISGSLVEIDETITLDGAYRFGVDDIDELETIKRHTQELVNVSRGTRYEQTANAVSAMVTAEIPDLLHELVMLSEGSEQQTF